MESQNQNPYHNPTPEQKEGVKQAQKELDRICEEVLERQRLKKLEKEKVNEGKKK